MTILGGMTNKKTTATANANAGVLRFAQNDGVWGAVRFFSLPDASALGEVDEADEEEGGEEVEHPVFLFGAAGEELDQGVAGQAEA